MHAKDIEAEREQAVRFALQATTLEDIGCPELALILRQLVGLCDLKVEILNALDQVPEMKALDLFPKG